MPVSQTDHSGDDLYHEVFKKTLPLVTYFCGKHARGWIAGELTHQAMTYGALILPALQWAVLELGTTACVSGCATHLNSRPWIPGPHRRVCDDCECVSGVNCIPIPTYQGCRSDWALQQMRPDGVLTLDDVPLFLFEDALEGRAEADVCVRVPSRPPAGQPLYCTRVSSAVRAQVEGGRTQLRHARVGAHDQPGQNGRHFGELRDADRAHA